MYLPVPTVPRVHNTGRPDLVHHSADRHPQAFPNWPWNAARYLAPRQNARWPAPGRYGAAPSVPSGHEYPNGQVPAAPDRGTAQQRRGNALPHTDNLHVFPNDDDSFAELPTLVFSLRLPHSRVRQHADCHEELPLMPIQDPSVVQHK